MTRLTLVLVLLSSVVVGSGLSQQPEPRRKARPSKPVGPSVKQWNVTGSHGVVVAGGPESVDIGLATLKAGGNAMDAAAATLLAQTVTDAQSYCFGGEVPILVYDSKRRVVEVLAGMGTAPRLATREHFVKKGVIPRVGLEPAAVPATLDAILTLLDRYGTRTFADITAPTLAILDRHEYEWHADLATTLRRLVEAEKAASGDRGRGIRLAADYFYRGPIAREIDAWCRANGGLLRFADLATHVTRIEEPVACNYRGYSVYKCGPWTQGPYLLQTLQLLEGFDVKSMKPGQADVFHLAVEAMKLALADRDVYYADPLFEEVPLSELLAPKYAELRRPLIDPKHASLVQRPGDPLHGKALLEKADLRSGSSGPARDTSTCATADAQGNLVAATPSGWSGVLAGKTGVWLGTRLQSFNTWEGHPNCIVPGKRPRITLTPTIVLRDGNPVIAVSVAGGDLQDQATLQMLMNVIDFGMNPAEAVTVPRFSTNHHVGSFGQNPPERGHLRISAEAGDSTIADLKARGHKVQIQRPAAAPTVITIDPQSKLLRAAGDPKAGRHATGY